MLTSMSRKNGSWMDGPLAERAAPIYLGFFFFVWDCACSRGRAPRWLSAASSGSKFESHVRAFIWQHVRPCIK